MPKIPPWLVIVPGVLAALAGGAISAPDKYTVSVPAGLSFSEFKGYEDWQSVSVSKTEHAFALILANPVMIGAYSAHQVYSSSMHRCIPKSVTCSADQVYSSSMGQCVPKAAMCSSGQTYSSTKHRCQ